MADTKDSFMMEPKSSTTTTISSSQKHHRTFLMLQNIFRIFVIVLTAVSIAVMVTNNQSFMVLTFQIEAHFYYSSSLKFFVAANGVVCFLSVLRLLINLLMRKQTPPRKDFYFYIFLLDLVMTLLLIAGCAAATAVGYVGQFGEERMGWPAVCNHVQKFCKTNLVSLLLSYLAFFANLGLTILIAYKCTS
ncbi:CASP protein 1E1 [Trifolium repens]|nr:CASP protein 1E1 [Trifolium repens]